MLGLEAILRIADIIFLVMDMFHSNEQVYLHDLDIFYYLALFILATSF